MACPTEQFSNYDTFQQSMIQNSLAQPTMQNNVRQPAMQRHPATMQNNFKEQARCSAKPGSCMCKTCISKYTANRPSMQHEKERSQMDSWKMRRATERNPCYVPRRERNDYYTLPSFVDSEPKVANKKSIESSEESFQEKTKYSAVTQTPIREMHSNWCQVTKSVCDSICSDESACSFDSAETQDETINSKEKSTDSVYSKTPDASRYSSKEPSHYSKVSEQSHYQGDGYQTTSQDTNKYKQSTCGSFKSKKSYPDKGNCYDTEIEGKSRASSKVSKEKPSEHSNNEPSVQGDGYQLSHPRSDSIKHKQPTNSDKSKECDDDEGEIEKIYERSKEKPSEKPKVNEKQQQYDLQAACAYQTNYQSSKSPSERKCRCKFCCSREQFVEKSKFSSFNHPSSQYAKDEPQESFSYRTAPNSEKAVPSQRSRSKSKARPSTDIEKSSRDRSKSKVSSHNQTPKLEVSVNEASIVRQDSTKQKLFEIVNRSRNSSRVKGGKEKSYENSLVEYENSVEEKHVCRPMSPLNIVLNLHLNLKPETFNRNEVQ